MQYIKENRKFENKYIKSIGQSALKNNLICNLHEREALRKFFTPYSAIIFISKVLVEIDGGPNNRMSPLSSLIILTHFDEAKNIKELNSRTSRYVTSLTGSEIGYKYLLRYVL